MSRSMAATARSRSSSRRIRSSSRVATLVERVGRPTVGVLVKLLDPAERLPVHAHPTRAFARQHLDSFFGKTEAWIILATRATADGPAPALRLGFRRDVAPEELRAWIDEERSEALLDAMHEVPARAGDAWLVPAGTPHAIGAGVFIAEVQEPTDFSIVAETRGFPIDRRDCLAGARLGRDAGGVDDPRPRRRRAPGAALRARAAAHRRRAAPGTPAPECRRPVLPRRALDGRRAVPGGRRTRVPRRDRHARRGARHGRARRLDGRGRRITFAVPAAGLRGLRIEATTLELIACRPPQPTVLEGDAG